MFRLESDAWRCSLGAAGALWLSELADRQSRRSLLAEPTPMVELLVDGVAGEVAAIETPAAQDLLFRWNGLPAPAAAELRVSLDGAQLRWRLSLSGHEQTCRVRSPFLETIRFDDNHGLGQTVVLDERAFRDKEGRLIFRHADWPLPRVWVGPEGQTLTLLVWSTSDPAAIDEGSIWSASGAELELSADRPMVFDGELALHTGRWPAAFDRFRTRIRDRFNLSQYQRAELSWYQDQIVQHFTFMYGREILNLATGEFEIDRFLNEGERDFGGYDGMLIWPVYPRIGIDERTQWDFFDDVPGGREGLRAMAQRARERGVRFFVPYKPWDRSAELHGRPGGADHERLAELVADVEADGAFLDTMSAISPEFRDAFDRARPGTVFCSEGRAKGLAFEIITGSWDQSPTRADAQGNASALPETMPGVDLWRFIFPEHRLFVINRHAVGADRMAIIQRGFFSGMGWVVWQDIFGLVLSYSPEEAALLKKCRTILREHRLALWSSHPTPLIPTESAGVYANEFPGEAKRLWTIYNETTSDIDACVLRVQPRQGCHFFDVWNDREVQVGADGSVHLRLGAHGLGALVELRSRLTYGADEGVLHVAEPAEGMLIELRQPGALRSKDAASGTLKLATGPARKEPVTARLLLAGELLDQIVIRPESQRL
jgi:hypothetical protein